MFQLFGDEDDAELSKTGPSEAEMIKQRTAAAEDVVILEVEEGVPELQRLTLLLKRGQPLQKLSALESLSRTVREHEGSACDQLLQLVASVLAEPSLDESCQEAAAVGLGELSLLLEPALLEQRVLPPMLKALQAGADASGGSSSQSLQDAVSEDVLRAWLGSLVALVEAGRLSADAMRRTVLPFALTQGEAARPVISRMVCCHVLGAVAAGYGEAGGICEQGTLSHALALCQDTEACVRACMGLQLVRLGTALGPQHASGNLLSELMELTRDEQPEVRHAPLPPPFPGALPHAPPLPLSAVLSTRLRQATRPRTPHKHTAAHRTRIPPTASRPPHPAHRTPHTRRCAPPPSRVAWRCCDAPRRRRAAPSSSRRCARCC